MITLLVISILIYLGQVFVCLMGLLDGDFKTKKRFHDALIPYYWLYWISKELITTYKDSIKKLK